MHKFIQIILIFLTIISISCKRDRKEEKYIIKSKWASDRELYQVKTDSIQIAIDSNSIATYFTVSIFTENNIDYLFGYNAVTSSIDIFNLTARKFYKRLKLKRDSTFFKNLDKQDLDKNRSITDIHVLNFDSIIVNYSNKKIFILDTSMRVKKVVELAGSALKNKVSGQSTSYSNNFRMFFFDKKLILGQIYSVYNWEEKVPSFLSLDLVKEENTFLPLTYSNYLYDIKGNAGYMTAIATSEFQKPGVLTYGFFYESNIYQYNPKDSNIYSYGGKMSNGKNIVDSISYHTDEDLKKWDVHILENSQFFNIMYDKYRKLYYRFSLKNIPYKNGKYYNSLLDKPLILMVFNEKLELIKELELPKYLYAVNTWFVTPEGLFISPTGRKNKFKDFDHLRYHIIKIKQHLLK